MTTFLSTTDASSRTLDVDAILDRIESDAPGADPVPLARDRILRILGVATPADTCAVEQAVMAGLRCGEFPERIELESPLRRLPKSTATPSTKDLPDHVEGFDLVQHLPNADSDARFRALIGLDEHKNDLLSVAKELRDPGSLERWASKHHPAVTLPMMQRMDRRVPLVVLAGDVGSGKTELAETFGSILAGKLSERIVLLRLGLAARGSGQQGQATLRVQSAFDAAKKVAAKVPVVLLLDEADALAQSREETQMHHEDRAGVNALIQAVDHVRELDGRLIVVMCTNRKSALDPALVRRAALILRFGRPDRAVRAAILRGALGGVVADLAIDKVADATGERCGRPGFTASDLVTRALPQAIRRAVANDRPLREDDLLDVVGSIEPTPPFKDEG